LHIFKPFGRIPASGQGILYAEFQELLVKGLARRKRARDAHWRQVLAEKKGAFFARRIFHYPWCPLTKRAINPLHPQIRQFTHVGVSVDDFVGHGGSPSKQGLSYED